MVVKLVAIDDGYAQTKLFGESPDGSGYVRYMMRSSIKPGKFALMSLDGRQGIGGYQTEEGETFTVSESIEGENTQFDSFHVSPMNRVLVHHALLSAGYGGADVDVVAGLPVSDYFRDGLKDEKRISEKTANLLKNVKNLASQDIKPARFKNVQIGCQATAAFVDYLLDDNLEEKDVPTESVAVVDIGGRTTDIVVILNGNQIDSPRSGTQNIGVLDVYNALSKAIRSKFETSDNFPFALLDKAVRENKIKLWGKYEDITDLVTNVVREQESKIAREVERKIGSASNVDSVLFVGGGSALFGNIGAHFRNGVMVVDPEFANARGLFKYAKKFSE